MLDVRKKDLQSLETFQRKTLKHLQGLSQNTATAAVYHLLGAIPVEGLLDQRFLSTFGNILQNENSTEFHLAKRQLLHKDENSHSWYIKLKGILEKYNLPHPLELLENPPKKKAWKNLYKTNLKKILDKTTKRGNRGKELSKIPVNNEETWTVSSYLEKFKK